MERTKKKVFMANVLAVPFNPLALASSFSSAKAYDSGGLLEHYEFHPRLITNPVQLRGHLAPEDSAVFLFSHYVWDAKRTLRLSKAIKRAYPNVLMIHGGPNVPKYREVLIDFMSRHTQVDIAVNGEGEGVIGCILAGLKSGVESLPDTLSEIPGLTLRHRSNGHQRLIWTGEPARISDLSTLPSPYLDGTFDAISMRWFGATIETNRGCPYTCTFCDWGSATNQKIRRFPLDRVYQELEWIGKNQAFLLFVADANFGIFPEDVQIAQQIAEVKRKWGYPREVAVSYAKNSTERLSEIVKIFVDAGLHSAGILALQTTDTQTLEVIRRKNIKTERYAELAQIFKREGLPLLTSDLIIGLPGQTYEAFKGDLQYCSDLQVWPKVYRASLLVNAPMAEADYVREYGIEANEDGIVVATKAASRADIERMTDLYLAQMCLTGFGTLKYVLSFLQWEFKLQVLDVVERLLQVATMDRSRQYSEMKRVLRLLVHPRRDLSSVEFPYRVRSVFIRWKRFYAEIRWHLEQDYGITESSALSAVFAFQEAVMPRALGASKKTVPLAHDVVTYFQERGSRPLIEFPPRVVTIEDIYGMQWKLLLGLAINGYHRIAFELQSELNCDRSDPGFLFILPYRLRHTLTSLRNVWRNRDWDRTVEDSFGTPVEQLPLVEARPQKEVGFLTT